MSCSTRNAFMCVLASVLLTHSVLFCQCITTMHLCVWVIKHWKKNVGNQHSLCFERGLMSNKKKQHTTKKKQKKNKWSSLRIIMIHIAQVQFTQFWKTIIHVLFHKYYFVINLCLQNIRKYFYGKILISFWCVAWNIFIIENIYDWNVNSKKWKLSDNNKQNL